MPLVKTSGDQVVNCPTVDEWKYEDVLRWSTINGGKVIKGIHKFKLYLCGPQFSEAGVPSHTKVFQLCAPQSTSLHSSSLQTENTTP